MAEFPALPLWTDAYIADTQHLTNEEHGVYMRLLMFAWRTPDCALPDDDRRLAIMVGVTAKKWATLKPTVMAFWTMKDGAWVQKKLTSEREFVERQRKQKSAAGKASSQAKSLKTNDVHSTAVSQPIPTARQQPTPTPTYIEDTPSGVSSAPPEKLDIIQAKLIEAIGEGNIQPHGALNLSAILGLISAGVDLETDIIPTIRAKAQRLTRPVGSWSYFTDAIRDAHNRRVQAGQGIVRPSTPEADDKRWAGRLKLARDRKYWSTPEWGPMPGLEGCIVPKSLLSPDDGKGWQEFKAAA